MLVEYSAAVDRDLRFIMATWCSQIRGGSHRGWPDDLFEAYRDTVLARLAPRSIVSHAPYDRDALYGWICSEQIGPLCLIHYVYVRPSRRGYGLGRALIDRAAAGRDIAFTHRGSRPIRGAYWPHAALEAHHDSNAHTS